MHRPDRSSASDHLDNLDDHHHVEHHHVEHHHHVADDHNVDHHHVAGWSHLPTVARATTESSATWATTTSAVATAQTGS